MGEKQRPRSLSGDGAGRLGFLPAAAVELAGVGHLLPRAAGILQRHGADVGVAGVAVAGAGGAAPDVVPPGEPRAAPVVAGASAASKADEADDVRGRGRRVVVAEHQAQHPDGVRERDGAVRGGGLLQGCLRARSDPVHEADAPGELLPAAAGGHADATGDVRRDGGGLHTSFLRGAVGEGAVRVAPGGGGIQRVLRVHSEGGGGDEGGEDRGGADGDPGGGGEEDEGEGAGSCAEGHLQEARQLGGPADHQRRFRSGGGGNHSKNQGPFGSITYLIII